MIWKKISNQHSSLQEYRLEAKAKERLVLKYNPRHNSARITFEDNYRLFYLESAGSMSGKTIFKNEYGMETGSLVFERSFNKEGLLTIDNKKYRFILNEEKLIISGESLRAPVDCNLERNNTIADSSFNNIDITCYVLGTCWFLFLPFAKETSLQYAAAS